MNEFNDMLEKAFTEVQGDSAFRMDRERPYNGQSHTDQGERGKTLVEGLTMRDISDCIVRGFLEAGGIQTENPIRDDIYKIDKELDFGAVIKRSICWIEKYMGIFPNAPELKERSKDQKGE